MKHKLVFIFDEEILNVPKALVFDNHKDAYEYFSSKGHTLMSLESNSSKFTVQVGIAKWESVGSYYWATHV